MSQKMNQKAWGIIVDIDGTLANIEHRRKFLDETPKNWKEFNKNMDKDVVNNWCTKLIQQLHVRYDVILCSGRMEEFREITEQWLKKNEINYKELFMRKQDDFRDDSIIKKEIFKEKIHDKYNILFVVDDRSKVVEMWRSIGLTCLQCCDGNY